MPELHLALLTLIQLGKVNVDSINFDVLAEKLLK
jgi:hypothetical protein